MSKSKRREPGPWLALFNSTASHGVLGTPVGTVLALAALLLVVLALVVVLELRKR